VMDFGLVKLVTDEEQALVVVLAVAA